MSSDKNYTTAFEVVKRVFARCVPYMTYVIMIITLDTIKCNTKKFFNSSNVTIIDPLK